jgi:radical SAM protein with 4Fe4S-binding SPASM domain
MSNLKYALDKLRTDFYLDGVSGRYGSGKPVPPPSYVLWDCTRRCNLNCVHCGASKETYPAELTTAQIKGIVDEIAALKIAMFAVTGGEPLLREDLLDVLAHARQRGMKTGIATNGFLLDRPMAKRIAEARVHSVQVSLDGTEPTHNEIRQNRRSYTAAMQAIELLGEIRVPVLAVATTVTGRNLPELDSLRELLLRLGVKLWKLTAVMPIGRAQSAEMSLDRERLVSLFEFVRKNNGRGIHIHLGENLTYLGKWERKLRSGPVICPAGFTACCIGVDGNVRGCPEQPDTADNREGSLLERSFTDIWQHGFGRYRGREMLSADPNCSTCEWKSDCFGGCWVMRSGNRHCIRSALA